MNGIFEEYSDIVSVEELMRMLRIGKNKAYELVQTGKIKSVRIGQIYKIPKLEIIEFLNKN